MNRDVLCECYHSVIFSSFLCSYCQHVQDAKTNEAESVKSFNIRGEFNNVFVQPSPTHTCSSSDGERVGTASNASSSDSSISEMVRLSKVNHALILGSGPLRLSRVLTSALCRA